VVRWGFFSNERQKWWITKIMYLIKERQEEEEQEELKEWI
jgi:hypothetical protein